MIISELGNFSPERFSEWIRQMDGKFRKVSMGLAFQISSRRVSFTIKELRSGRRVYQFKSSTSVRFEDGDVAYTPEAVAPKF